MSDQSDSPGRWADGTPPTNVVLGPGTVVSGAHSFRRFRSQETPGLVIGSRCTMDGVQFALGPSARVRIGDYCYLTNVILLAEIEVRVGDYVMIGWNTAISDTDFHPLEPALRIADAIACSPTAKDQKRPPIACKAVVIEDDVWIGPSCTILKGVRIGAGSFIEPGSIITRDVPPNTRMMGNPAMPVPME